MSTKLELSKMSMTEYGASVLPWQVNTSGEMSCMCKDSVLIPFPFPSRALFFVSGSYCLPLCVFLVGSSRYSLPVCVLFVGSSSYSLPLCVVS